MGSPFYHRNLSIGEAQNARVVLSRRPLDPAVLVVGGEAERLDFLLSVRRRRRKRN